MNAKTHTPPSRREKNLRSQGLESRWVFAFVEMRWGLLASMGLSAARVPFWVGFMLGEESVKVSER